MGIIEIRLRPENILFEDESVRVVDARTGKHRLFYSEIVLACLRVWDQKKKQYWEPEITDITSDMEGDLILYDKGHCRWEIRTDRSGKKAGSLLEEICIHAPFVMAGFQSWFDRSGRSDFERIAEMGEAMRVCGGR